MILNDFYFNIFINIETFQNYQKKRMIHKYNYDDNIFYSTSNIALFTMKFKYFYS